VWKPGKTLLYGSRSQIALGTQTGGKTVLCTGLEAETEAVHRFSLPA
jgi:hypothetical protein